ncbi:MAG: DUF4173 domain-containing protein [Acutalibacteraceae bacterium]|nr:DUF4173 domain-containing protein [Acutalibacteraceae bacterium]
MNKNNSQGFKNPYLQSDDVGKSNNKSDYNDNYSNTNADVKKDQTTQKKNNGSQQTNGQQTQSQQPLNNNQTPPNAPPPPNNFNRPPNVPPPPNNFNRPPNAPPPPYNFNVPPYPQQRPMANIKKRVYDKADTVFGWLAIAVGFLFILTIGSLWFDFGIGATIFFEASLVVSYCYAIKRKLEIDIFHNISFFLLMILSLSFSFFSNPLALGADFVFIALAHAYWLYSIGEEKEDSFLNEIMTSIFVYPFENYGALFGAVFKKSKNNQKSNLKWILLGLCIAVPLVCVVSYLLIKSDDMFKAMFSAIFDDFLSKVLKYLWYAVVGLPVAMAVFSIWYTKYTEDKKEVLSKNNNASSYSKKEKFIANSRIAPPAMMYAISIPLCCVYFLYLISQVSYFISFIADNLLPKDYTIVDYARNGFFELCVVVAINIVLILLLLILTERPNNVMPKGLRVITILMSAFTLIFIGTALYKMFMYIKTYGFTPARIHTILFMSFLLVIFVLIIANQFFKNMKFPAIVMVVAILFMLGYNIIDVDSFVAKQNIKLYKEDKISWMGMDLVYELDYSALGYLAEFASDENNGLSESENDRLDRELRNRYEEHRGAYSIDDHKDLFSFNFNEYKSHKLLKHYGYDEEYMFDYEYDYPLN